MSKKIAIILLLLLGYTKVSYAQSASAHQTVVLQLNPIIQFENVGINTSVNSTNSNPSFKVSSNANYIVSVKTIDLQNDKRFAMALNNEKEYTPITATRQDVIVNGNRGSEQSFAINYKKSKGAHNTDNNELAVVYTATAP